MKDIDEKFEQMASGCYPLPISAEEMAALIGYLITQRDKANHSIPALMQKADEIKAQLYKAELKAKYYQHRLNRLLGVQVNEQR